MYEWNAEKRQENLARHGIDFSTIEDFDWSPALTGESYRETLPISEAGKNMPRPDPIAADISEVQWEDILARDLPFIEIEAIYGEEVAIYAGIARDPDAAELDDEWFKRARPAIEVFPDLVEHSIRKSMKAKTSTQESVLVRLDGDLVLHFLSSGPGWETQLNDTLRRAVFGSSGTTSE